MTMVVVGGELRGGHHCSKAYLLLPFSPRSDCLADFQKSPNLSMFCSHVLDPWQLGLLVGECSPWFEMRGCLTPTGQQICLLEQNFLN